MTPNYDNLISEVADAISQHFKKWVTEHSTDEIYAYVVYATPLVSSIAISVMTEQGLREVASDYKTKYEYDEPLEKLITDLRWSVADTPYCGDYQELFETVNDRLGAMMSYVDSLDYDDPALTIHTRTLCSILVNALNGFRQDTLRGENRPLLYVDFGDMSDEERLGFIQQCNRPAMVEWYTSSINGAG